MSDEDRRDTCDDDQQDAESFGPSECAAQFFAYVVDLKVAGPINATQACISSWWASRAGDAIASGDTKAVGMPPWEGLWDIFGKGLTTW